ncbi:MAG: cache domain-containing protein [Candidatus Competibacter sp.]|nr:cache domain-containing protein [Candidatus Competibacter sp.]
MSVQKSIKTRFVTILLFTEILVIAAFIGTIFFIFQNNIRESSLQIVKNTQGFYNGLIENDIKMLSATLDTFATNEAFRQQFNKGNIDILQKAGEELFTHNRNRYGITHFYYIDNEGICRLRMHQPNLSGDKITRATFEAAKKNRRLASGIELGQTAYALRVVVPYLDNGNQIGFVEFGEEIDHFNNIVKNETGIDITLLGDKQYLKQEAYKATRNKAGKPDNWNDIANYVILGSTFNQQDYFVNNIFRDEEVKNITKPVYLGTVNYNDRTLMKGAFPFYSFGDQRTGLVYVLGDVTDQISDFRWLLIYVLLGGALVILASFWIALHYMQAEIVNPIVALAQRAERISLGKGLDEEITTNRVDEIGLLTNAFERMRVSLSKVMQMVAGAGKS